MLGIRSFVLSSALAVGCLLMAVGIAGSFEARKLSVEEQKRLDGLWNNRPAEKKRALRCQHLRTHGWQKRPSFVQIWRSSQYLW